MMGARVVVAGLAGRGRVRWRRGTRVAVVPARCWQQTRPWDGHKNSKQGA